MVETMAGSEALILVVVSFAIGYLTCSTIMYDDMKKKYENMKNKYYNVKQEKEFLENNTNHYNYRDIA